MPDFEFSWPWVVSVLLMLLKAIAILLIGHIIIKLILKVLSKSFRKTKLDISLEKFLIKIVNITLHAVVILSALTALGISTTGLLAALSAAAVGVALALKDSLSSIAGGILLLISPRFATGDFIEINGESGTVMQVDLIHTTLKTLDNRHIVIPNSAIVNNQLINYSSEEKRRLDLTFSIGYDNDASLAIKLILDTINEQAATLREPDEPFVRIGEYAASSVDITTRVWCQAKDYWQLKFDLLEQVRRKFDDNGISIPYNQLDVHVINK